MTNDEPRTGLTLTPHQRMHLANRIMLQRPPVDDPVVQERFLRSISRNLNEIPGDVVFTLEAIRLLADQGNKQAADLFDFEIERLGLTRTRTFG